MRIVDFDVALPQTPLRRLPTPLVLPAIGLGAGIALDNLAPLPLIATAGALFAACGLALIARWQPRAWAAAVVLASVALGAARHDLAMRRWPADHVARFVGAHPILGTIRGLVIDAPVTYEPLATATRAYDVPGRTRLRIDARTWIDTAGGRHPATGRVLVYLTPATADLQPGDEIEVFGLVSRIAGPANPGEFDRRLYLARDGVWVALSANTREAVSLVARPSHSAWRRWLRNLRLRLAATLRETGDGAADEAVGSVLDALILARRSGVERSINDAFQKTGNSHLLAASGLNVGWLVLCVWLIAFPLDWHYRTTAAVALVVLLAYAVIAEPNPPILRAVLMGVIGCIGLILRQRFNALNWLAAAAIILLLFNPGILFAASFQLSFVVVLGLILLAPLVPDPIHAVDRWRRGLSKPPADLASVDEDSMHLRSAFLEFLLDAVRITSICALTAWLVGLPLSVYHFGMFAPWGFVNSILLAPFAFVVMVLGFLKLILAPIAYVSVDLLGPALHGVTKAMNGVVLKMAAIPGTSLSIEPPSPVWVACCYVLMLLWLWRARGPALGWPSLRLPRGALPLAAALLAVWPFLPLKAWLRPRDRVTVWTLAVGNGTATVIELPDGRTLLYDCGSRSSFDAAARSVVPFLRWRGIRSIDAAFVSHPDLDHYSGIEGVSKAVAIRRLVLNEHFEEFGADQPAVTEFLRRVRELGIPVERIRAGWALADSRGAAVECLWPPPAGAFITNDNSTSTVLRIAFADRALLLTGDIDNYALDQLLARGGLACDAMHLPHHGSVTALTGRFLDAARPSVAIRSSGQHDRDTRNGLLSLVRNMTYFNTADDGCIRMTLGRDGVEATPHRGRPD